MTEIVFKPKYSGSSRILMAVVVICAVLLAGVGIIVLFLSFDKHMSDKALLRLAAFGILLLAIEILAIALQFKVRHLKIKDGKLSVVSGLGVRNVRPYSPIVYHESRFFIINGFVFNGAFMSNLGELDTMFSTLSANGCLTYLRSGLLSMKKKKQILLSILALLLGAVFAVFIIKMNWNPLTMIFYLWLILFIFFLNKLPRADSATWQNIQDMARGAML